MTAMITPPPDYRKTLENGLKGLRIAWSPRLGYVKQVESDIARLTEAAARRFAELGASSRKPTRVSKIPSRR